MNFNFGEVLTRAWQITWKYKVLWIFGILAGCAEGSGGSGNNGIRNGGDGNNPFPQYQQYADAFGRWITENWWVVVLFVIVIFVLIIIAIFLGTIGRIGLIRGTLQAETGTSMPAFGALFSQSTPFFWRIFGLSLLFGLAVFAVFFSLFMAGVLTAGIGFLCILPIICILIPVMIFLGLVLEQAYIAMVKENLGIVEGWNRGWTVVRNNLGPILVMWLIMGVLTFIIGLLIALPIILIFIPAVFAYAVGNQQDFTPLLIAGGISLLYLPILILLRGILATYKGSAWTLTYLRLTSPASVEILPPPAEPPVEANA